MGRQGRNFIREMVRHDLWGEGREERDEIKE